MENHVFFNDHTCSIHWPEFALEVRLVEDFCCLEYWSHKVPSIPATVMIEETSLAKTLQDYYYFAAAAAAAVAGSLLKPS